MKSTAVRLPIKIAVCLVIWLVTPAFVVISLPPVDGQQDNPANPSYEQTVDSLNGSHLPGTHRSSFATQLRWARNGLLKDSTTIHRGLPVRSEGASYIVSDSLYGSESEVLYEPAVHFFNIADQDGTITTVERETILLLETTGTGIRSALVLAD